MILDRVTFTGADDSVDPQAVVDLAVQYPHSEWGILFTGDNQGADARRGEGTRFPSFDWVADFLSRCPEDVKICAHLCGHYVFQLLAKDDLDFLRINEFDPERFQRIQVNFHGAAIPKSFGDIMIPVFKRYDAAKFIFQCDGQNDDLVKKWVKAGVGSPLFDISGGAGVTPDFYDEGWPKSWDGVYCGYAGGLGPDNVVKQLELIRAAAGDARIWIDMETRVRSNRDRLFDLAKCEQVLKAVLGDWGLEKTA